MITGQDPNDLQDFAKSLNRLVAQCEAEMHVHVLRKHEEREGPPNS